MFELLLLLESLDMLCSVYIHQYFGIGMLINDRIATLVGFSFVTCESVDVFILESVIRR